MHPVGFIIRIYHGARSAERQVRLVVWLFIRLFTEVCLISPSMPSVRNGNIVLQNEK